VNDVVTNSSLTEREEELALGFKKYQKDRFKPKKIPTECCVITVCLYFGGK
jgi:hypothetical protein